MSYVTDVVMHVETGGADDAELLRMIISTLPFDERKQKLQMLDHGKAGGQKAFEGYVFAAGMNWLNIDRMVMWFYRLPWGDEDYALLSLSSEGVAHAHFCVKDGKPIPTLMT